MARLLSALKRFFFPPITSSPARLLIPYASLGVVTILAFVSGSYVWDYTNSPPFCGSTCHTMPPEYTAYQVSPHARVQCVECHIGRGFFGTQFLRKAGDIKHVTATLFHNYEFPITAGELRPARETCEKCHFPEKFSDDSLVEIRHYADDLENTPINITLVLKTGGGSKRQGLGKGIHWHVENRVLYYPTAHDEQTIPYVRVYEDDGSVTEYVDIASGFDKTKIDDAQLKEMDCITCHNRITHRVNTPEVSIDQAIARGLIDPGVPEIHRQGIAVLRNNSQAPQAVAISAIGQLDGFYRGAYPDYYAAHPDKIQQAIATLVDIYTQSVYPEQKSDWNSHPNNLGHKDFPGCFRCHDGKHLDAQQQAVRLECNLCHSIPVVTGAQDFVTRVEISRGPEPQGHLNPNWIALHNQSFDESCALCHTTGNPGGIDNSSFCSNSACHGAKWQYAGLDAPALKAVIDAQRPTPTATATPAGTAATPTPAGPPTYAAGIQPIFTARCGACHGDARAAGMKLTEYADAMAGSENGPVIVPGDAENSKLVQVQREGKHFAQLSDAELELVVEWINAGAKP